ncbi:aspartyl-phosphate phosphatase Spo0E family protein [Clostridium sp. MB40-C1]|uniref:aspartyl-phosphate phosphatase Spo0E family protein n=1 Tax=Clostridium sp. MB40-C1 TaxID=3070996 RepID=UPI0027DEC335|nr:aspartyl-phosphate phosphatase Spo0E family protein [Clostridium sp. MB40-C1]WMJ79866.1 aspartyl-phosphate phosphatase Spo0E family protein [Clostridium sp. MB40-C1]
MDKEILSEINTLKEKLNTLVGIKNVSLSDEEVLTISVKLDKLINNYIKISSNTQN